MWSKIQVEIALASAQSLEKQYIESSNQQKTVLTTLHATLQVGYRRVLIVFAIVS